MYMPCVALLQSSRFVCSESGVWFLFRNYNLKLIKNVFIPNVCLQFLLQVES